MAIRPMTFGASVSAVSVSHDDAFDLEAMARMKPKKKKDVEEPPFLARYIAEARRNPGIWREMLTPFVKDGHSPTEFILGPLTGEDLARMEDECVNGSTRRHTELFWRSFLMSVRDIKGMDCRDAEKITRKGHDYIDPDWLSERFGFGVMRKVALEIGAMAYSWNQTAESEIKN